MHDKISSSTKRLKGAKTLFSVPLGLCAKLVCLGVILSACNNLKYLPKGEKLYTGAKVTVNDKSPDQSLDKKQRKKLEKELETFPRPKPNKTLFGRLRPGLWFYNIAGHPKKKGLRYWIKNKLGERPVLFSQVDPGKNSELLKNRLENKGFFHPDVWYQTVESKRHTISLDFVVNVGKPYRYARIIWPKGDSLLSKAIASTHDSSLLKVGDQYDLDVMKEERERITSSLKNRGYFYFNADFLFFDIDSTLGNRQLDLYVRSKKPIQPYMFRQYILGKIFIKPNYSLRRDTVSKKKADTLLIDGYYYIGNKKLFHPKVITQSVFLKTGDQYSQENYELTLYRLMNLGAFKFVNVHFDRDSTRSTQFTINDKQLSIDTNTQGLLHTRIWMTPMPKRTLRTELRLVSKSNDFAGPQATVSLRNRNFLHGAELFILSVNGSVETLITGEHKGVTNYTYGADAQLQLPRFYVPFVKINPPSRYVPRTIIGLGYQQLSQVGYYHENAFNIKAGYKWQQTARSSHELYPISINYLQLGKTSDKFDQLIGKSPILRTSFEKQFILGGSYTYNYATAVPVPHRFDIYFIGTLDESGNAASLIRRMISGHKADPDNPQTLLGHPYSQYSIVSLDVRPYMHPDKKNTLASRLFVGVGKPYGNSEVLPYIKEFWIGGNNSIRAFRARSLGPGTYHNDTAARNFFIDQIGDMRLEGNLEWRPDIYSILKGAVFLDAGNIWLLEDDPSRPGGKFDPRTFMHQLAVGTGLGLRIDASFFVLRFDLGFPLRKPWLSEGSQWVIRDINFGSHNWRKQNLVLNIGIGYPF